MLHSVSRSYPLDIKPQEDYNMLKKPESGAVKYIRYIYICKRNNHYCHKEFPSK